MADRTRVKICGLTRVQDVRAACALGADAVGFVCHPGSPRYVDPERLAELAAAVPALVTPVLLFVRAGREQVLHALAAVPQALLQFHGDEDEPTCAGYGRPYVRAVPMVAGIDLLDFESRFCTAAALLADTPAEQVTAAASAPEVGAAGGGAAGFGGSGRAFDWSRLGSAAGRRKPWILAGGLGPDNVAEAIARARPYAVDVSSGVEEARGIKSEERMRRFFAAVRRADARSGVQ